MFLHLDSETGAALLARPEKMAVMADLLHEEAEIMRTGKQNNPRDMDRRALEHALEVFIVAPQSEGNASRIRKLAKYVQRNTLDKRYQI